jgi:hypothetical protein
MAFRPPPKDLHHSDGRPCAACDWSDAWSRTKWWLERLVMAAGIWGGLAIGRWLR